MGVKTRKLGNVNTDIVEWQAVKTSDFTAVAGEGYFINTTSGQVTITLPATAHIGDTIRINDFAGTAGTNNIIIARNGLNPGFVGFGCSFSPRPACGI